MARLLTASNQRYFERIRPYLESLAKHSQISATLIAVGDDRMPKCPVEQVNLPRVYNRGAPAETESPQHGAWLNVVDGPADEVIIFTDGDIIAQRPFSDLELSMIEDVDEGELMAGYNSGPSETLAIEAGRLQPRFQLEKIGARMGLLDRPCFNIGVVVGRRATFQRIYDEYMKHWQVVSDAFGHPARQQWLVVWTAHRLGMAFCVTPYSFHANGHYGVPPGCIYADGGLYYGNELVLFRHKL